MRSSTIEIIAAIDPAPPPRGLLLCAAIGSALLWVCVVGFAIGAVDGLPLLASAAVGALGTAALLPAAQTPRGELEGLAGTDPLTGLANHRGFHQELDAANSSEPGGATGGSHS